MTKLDAHERLRRAASLLAHEGTNAGDRTLLLQAWEVLRGLRSDDFPVDMRPAFNFLQHEIARAESEDVSARDVAFLSEQTSSTGIDVDREPGKRPSRGEPRQKRIIPQQHAPNGGPQIPSGTMEIRGKGVAQT